MCIARKRMEHIHRFTGTDYKHRMEKLTEHLQNNQNLQNRWILEYRKHIFNRSMVALSLRWSGVLEYKEWWTYWRMEGVWPYCNSDSQIYLRASHGRSCWFSMVFCCVLFTSTYSHTYYIEIVDTYITYRRQHEALSLNVNVTYTAILEQNIHLIECCMSMWICLLLFLSF